MIKSKAKPADPEVVKKKELKWHYKSANELKALFERKKLRPKVAKDNKKPKKNKLSTTSIKTISSKWNQEKTPYLNTRILDLEVYAQRDPLPENFSPETEDYGQGDRKIMQAEESKTDLKHTQDSFNNANRNSNEQEPEKNASALSRYGMFNSSSSTQWFDPALINKEMLELPQDFKP